MIQAIQVFNCKQKGKIDFLSISIQENCIVITFLLSGDYPQINIEYSQVERGCLIKCKETGNEKLEENMDFLSVFCDDLSGILIEQNAMIYVFEIYHIGNIQSIGSRIFTCFEMALNLRNQKIQIRKFTLDFYSLEQINSLLGLIDPESLAGVSLKLQSSRFMKSLDEVIVLEQWKEFKNVKFSAIANTLSSNELMVIKKTLLTSQVFKLIGIYYEEIDISLLDEIFGTSTHHQYGTIRKIRVPDTKRDVLTVTVYPNKCIDFAREKCRPDFNTEQLFNKIIELPLNCEGPLLKVLMNPLIMNNLSSYLGFVDIQALRKTSSGIRKCIDYIKPDPEISKLMIKSKNFVRVDVQMSFQDKASPLYIQYMEVDPGCLVNENWKEKIVVDHKFYELNQWIYAKELVIKDFVVPVPFKFQYFIHFVKLDVLVESISSGDVYELKEELLYSPSFIKFKIEFQTCSIDNDDLFNLLGPSYNMENDRLASKRKTWYFEMPERDRVLHIVYHVDQKILIFKKVGLEEIPEDVFFGFEEE